MAILGNSVQRATLTSYLDYFEASPVGVKLKFNGLLGPEGKMHLLDLLSESQLECPMLRAPCYQS